MSVRFPVYSVSDDLFCFQRLILFLICRDAPRPAKQADSLADLLFIHVGVSEQDHCIIIRRIHATFCGSGTLPIHTVFGQTVHFDSAVRRQPDQFFLASSVMKMKQKVNTGVFPRISAPVSSVLSARQAAYHDGSCREPWSCSDVSHNTRLR